MISFKLSSIVIALLVLRNVAQVPNGWTCDPDYFHNQDRCDCNCGGYDLDCDDPTLLLFGCEASQFCNLEGQCENVSIPGNWVCFDDFFNGKDGCDCYCGAYDPDCDDETQILFGCDTGEFCNFDGTCGSYPTSSPISSPTSSPTTFNPTFSPISNPSTLLPTSSPGVIISDVPTMQPSYYTFHPMTKPTHVPTQLPTFEPTHSPGSESGSGLMYLVLANAIVLLTAVFLVSIYVLRHSKKNNEGDAKIENELEAVMVAKISL